MENILTERQTEIKQEHFMRVAVNNFLIKALMESTTLDRCQIIQQAMRRAKDAKAPSSVLRALKDKLILEEKIHKVVKVNSFDYELPCPYCGKETTINTTKAKQLEDLPIRCTCKNCHMNFVAYIKAHIDYTAQRAYCLNGGSHSWKADRRIPIRASKMVCQVCGKTRQPTKSEIRLHSFV